MEQETLVTIGENERQFGVGLTNHIDRLIGLGLTSNMHKFEPLGTMFGHCRKPQPSSILLRIFFLVNILPPLFFCPRTTTLSFLFDF